MNTWPEGPVPCGVDPERWRVPSLVHLADVDVWCRRMGDAINECRACPALAACGQWAAEVPPQRHVQAGLIYDGAAQGLHVYQWRAKLRNRAQARGAKAKRRVA